MALIRALNTAVSGLKTQQFRIELVGHNIANVDTTAYKAARAEFNTILSQLVRAGIAPQGNLGGIDPIHLGLGAQVGATTTNFNQGPVKLTGVASDLALDGDGFFVLRDGTGEQVYTRDGSFSINPSNLLHDTATGAIVQGWGVDENFQVQSGGPLENIVIPVGAMKIARATESARLEGNLNSAGQVAADGTWLLSDVLYDSRFTNDDLISDVNPLGLARATEDTPLVSLVRSLGDHVAATDSTAGTAGTAALVFPDLAQSPTGLEIQVSAEKGQRALAPRTFVVGDPPPRGGAVLGDFIDFLARTLGIVDHTFTGQDQVAHTYGFARKNPISGEAINGTISKGQVGGPDDQATLTSITDHQADFRGVEVGDFIRFTSGAASGQIAQITAITASTPGGTLDTLQLRSGTFNALSAVPAYGDTYAIHAPAGVRVAGDTVMTEVASTSPTVTVSGVTTTGGVSTFTVTDLSVADFAAERGLAVDQVVTYYSGGQLVRGRVVESTGNAVTIAYRSALSQAPDATTAFTFADLAGGTVTVAGNVGDANGIANLEVLAGDSRVSLFDNPARAEAQGESLTTRFTVYDSLGTPRQVDLTLLFQSSSSNGPNVFRYFAESPADADGHPFTGSGTILFGPQGQFLGTGEAEEVVTVDLHTSADQAGGVTTPFSFRLDLSRVTQLASRESSVILGDQDGFESGTLRSYAFDRDGTIVGVFDNGLVRNLGQVAVARFANPNGLEATSENMYRVAPNAGIPQVGTPGSGGRAFVRGGYLEESNVDLAEQFTELIIGQRAFQANARTVTTSNELLQELVNLL
jgi:flagellar hook protein FlgE